jgi:hypothetical protein
MKEYIVNLTNNLIRKNRYDELFTKMNNPGEFLAHVTFELESQDVRVMNPEKLGIIMCSLETGDIMAGKKELLGSLNFSGDCEETLRQFVALCLAYVIKERLDPHPASPTVVPYTTSQGRSLGRLISNLGNDPEIRTRMNSTKTVKSENSKECGLRMLREGATRLNKQLQPISGVTCPHMPTVLIAHSVVRLLRSASLYCPDEMGHAFMESVSQSESLERGFCLKCGSLITQRNVIGSVLPAVHMDGYCIGCEKKIEKTIQEDTQS